VTDERTFGGASGRCVNTRSGRSASFSSLTEVAGSEVGGPSPARLARRHHASGDEPLLLSFVVRDARGRRTSYVYPAPMARQVAADLREAGLKIYWLPVG
jgi:hypothetical protein